MTPLGTERRPLRKCAPRGRDGRIDFRRATGADVCDMLAVDRGAVRERSLRSDPLAVDKMIGRYVHSSNFSACHLLPPKAVADATCRDFVTESGAGRRARLLCKLRRRVRHSATPPAAIPAFGASRVWPGSASASRCRAKRPKMNSGARTYCKRAARDRPML